MVATSGRGWHLAPCLVALVNETDRLFPDRSTTSDGSIGDLAHSTRASDHNPDDGWVCAVDITDDKANGCDADLLARHIVASKDPRVKYVIWNGTIAKSYENRGLPAWTPQPYTGSNPHDKHTHISCHNTATARNRVAPWWPTSEEIDMADVQDILDKLAAIELRVIDVEKQVPNNLNDQLAEIRRNLRKTAEAAGVPAGEIES